MSATLDAEAMAAGPDYIPDLNLEAEIFSDDADTHQLVVVIHSLISGLVHQEAYGPVECRSDDFMAIPHAVSKAEAAFSARHPEAIWTAVTAHVLLPVPE